VTGLSRPEAGRGNRALVAEGYASMLATGVYRLSAGTAATPNAQLAIATQQLGDPAVSVRSGEPRVFRDRNDA
jgi:hypothetical protein